MVHMTVYVAIANEREIVGTVLSQRFGPAWWVWLWPTIVGAPAITIWTAYYKKKFSPKPKTVIA